MKISAVAILLVLASASSGFATSYRLLRFQATDMRQTDAALEAQVREIASKLRCPTCRSLSVYDSPSEMARAMRDVIREQLHANRSEEEITAYFVDKYGEWILLEPPAKGLNWSVWLAPLLLVVGGLVFVLYTARRWVERGRAEEAALLDALED